MYRSFGRVGSLLFFCILLGQKFPVHKTIDNNKLHNKYNECMSVYFLFFVCFFLSFLLL